MSKILVIDDDEPIRDFLAAILGSKDIEVLQAENGDDGITMARENSPDLIILDMNMPGMTGWEVLPVLKSHPDTKDIPVVGLSGHSNAEDRDKAYDSGCELYLTKPIDPMKVLTAVMEILK